MAQRLVGEHFRFNGVPKRGYPNRESAIAGKPDNQTVYRCKFCGRWHRATVRT